MVNVVVIIGSMRENGNTQMLARRFAEGAEQNNSVEVVSVSDYSVAPCNGCNSCYGSEGHRCCIDDDMGVIYDKLSKADVLVIASPVYFYGLSAAIKSIIDRLHAPVRNTFPIRKLGLLLVAATDIPRLFDPIVLQYELALDFFHLESIGIITVGGVKDKGDIAGSEALDKAYRLGLSVK